MTWLIRKIDDPDPWLDLGDPEEAARLMANPPLWAVRLFIPSLKDEGSLSLYEVDGEEGAKQVAAAWGFSLGDIDKASTKISFIAASRESIEQSGFDIEHSMGALNHITDEQHRGISLHTWDDAKQLTQLFIVGELFNFEAKIVKSMATQEAQAEHFKFREIARKGSNNTAARNILKLIGSDDVGVRGAKAA